MWTSCFRGLSSNIITDSVIEDNVCTTHKRRQRKRMNSEGRKGKLFHEEFVKTSVSCAAVSSHIPKTCPFRDHNTNLYNTTTLEPESFQTAFVQRPVFIGRECSSHPQDFLKFYLAFITMLLSALPLLSHMHSSLLFLVKVTSKRQRILHSVV